MTSLYAGEDLRHYWEALAATLNNDSHTSFDNLLHPKSQQCKLLINGLMKEFVDNASFSVRTPHNTSRSQAFGGRISFDNFADGPLLVKALTAAIHLQLLPESASLMITDDNQDLDRIPLLVAMGSIVFEEAERLGHRLTLLGVTDMLRSLSIFGYAISVLTMLSWKDPLYTGVAIAHKYRNSSYITDEIADLIELIDSKTILNGILLALEGLVETPEYLKTLYTARIPDRDSDLGRYEIDTLHHTSKVLKIPSDLTKSVCDKSQVTEFLTLAEGFLKITIVVVKEGSWLDKHDPQTKTLINELVLCCAALAAAERDEDVPLSWTTTEVRLLAADFFYCIVEAFYGKRVDQFQSKLTASSLGWKQRGSGHCEKFMLDFLPITLPILKSEMESDLDFDGKEVLGKIGEDSAAVAAHQMFWCLKQVSHPHLGPLCPSIMPCALTSLNHYSADVKRQGMKTFMHLANNLNPTELRWYKDVILDGITRSLVGCDELWPIFVEGAVTLVTCMEGKNTRGKWYRRTLDEMLGELERQRSNVMHFKAWLQHIGKLFEHMGLVLVAHFKRLLPLLFFWLHTADDSVSLLVLQNLCIIIKHTWPRIPYHSERFWEQLVLVYKESANRQSVLNIRAAVIDVSLLLKLCGGHPFELSWKKCQDDSTLELLLSALAGTNDQALSYTMSKNASS